MKKPIDVIDELTEPIKALKNIIDKYPGVWDMSYDSEEGYVFGANLDLLEEILEKGD